VVRKLVPLLLLLWVSVAQAEPREREILRERPSGFWTSNRPATHGAYRWRLLGLGVVIAGLSGYMIVRVLRNPNVSREGRGRDRS